MNETKNHDVDNEKVETTKKKRASSTAGKRRTRTSCAVESWTREKNEKTSNQILPTENETYRNFQALLLATSVLVLSYHGFRYGKTEYSVLENGNIVNGFVSARRAVITFSLGYPVIYSFVSSLFACMLLYSIFWKKPRWSLPSIIVYLMDLVCHVADALVAFWLFFGHLKFTTALLYTTITALIIRLQKSVKYDDSVFEQTVIEIGVLITAGELWIWLGVLRLYEHRTFN